MKRMLKFLDVGGFCRAALLSLSVTALFALSAGAQELNTIKTLEVDSAASGSMVRMVTEQPVGYRYTVYDSFDPIRVVVDFPGMDISALEPVRKVSLAPVEEVRVSSYELESGKLGRVEILLDKATNYEVTLKDLEFQILFATAEPTVSSLGAKLTKVQPAAPPVAAATAVQPSPQAQATVDEPAVAAPTMAAAEPVLLEPVVESGGVTLQVSAPFARHQYFNLGSPPRLVVDLYGVKPGFSERSFSVNQGMSRMRVGIYADKTRLVFDAESAALPGYQVSREGSQVKVAWGADLPRAVVDQSAAGAAGSTAAIPVTVEALDFSSQAGQSVFSVRLSAPAEVVPATQSGDVVRFGVKNALVSQKLRRTVDTSAFPSAVRMITPYTVQTGDLQDVRFAVELKGPSAYSIQKTGNLINFVVEDGPFAEARVQATTQEEILLKSAPAVSRPKTAAQPAPTELDVVLAETVQLVQPESAAGSTGQAGDSIISSSQGSYRIAEEKAGYSGEKISLVFDNADIRKILQLIAEVSDLNIIASDDVKGSITLRLQEVPWDQALDLIMDIQDLGMVREGNVARIMPRNRIRAMEESKLTAKRTKEKLEDLVTEVISISYTDLANIESPARELLTDRGKITKDDRNKQIIVTDIPSVISDVKNLVSILDTPERQVMIEARIVEADSSFSRDLGVKWGVSYEQNVNGADETSLNLGLGGAFLLNPPIAGGVSGSSGLASSMTFGKIGADHTILNLRLSALETSGHGKVVSTPRVTTLNGETAKISQGTQIPYVVQSDNGPNTEFVEAALSLEVTPVINPDGSIILEIKATNSTPGSTVSTGTGGSAPSINSKEAETKVLVMDGETTVLGGIYVEDEDYSETGVPWLSKVPFLGHLFKSTSKTKSRSELLVFITPRILQ